MASYKFLTVTDVLPLGVQRGYVPRASRPHLAWASAASTAGAGALGGHARLKGDGTAAREGAAAQAEREKEEEEQQREQGQEKTSSFTTTSAPAAPASSSSDVTLRGLLTTDGATGTQLTLYHDVTAPGVPVCSSAVPSHRRVVALWSPTPAGTGDHDGFRHFTEGEVPLYVSDELGNIFHYHWGPHGGDVREPSTKRHRGEAPHHDDSAADAWTQVTTAASHLPSSAACPSLPSSSSPLTSLFSLTRGAPGWAGLAALQSGSDAAASAPQLVSVREFYHDVRIIDPEQREVVRVYGTTHAPTGLLCPSAQAAPHCVLVAEGCLATLFDVRCPGAALTLTAAYAAQAEWAAAKEAAAAEKAQQQQLQDAQDSAVSAAAARGEGDRAAESESSGAKTVPSPAPAPLPPLVPGRLTSTVGQVRDVCATANPFEVACAVDRALCVYDLRKFSRLFTSSSVLKYVVGGVTSLAGGRAVVCTGIDSEVRLVPLYDKTALNAPGAEALSLAARAVAQAQAQAQKKKKSNWTNKKNEDGTLAFDVDTMGPGGLFRTRLNTSVSCTSVWQGGWVTTQDLDGVAAVGVSMDGEVFLAQ